MSEIFVRIPLKMLKIGGLHPIDSNSFFDKFEVFFVILTSITLGFLSILGFYFANGNLRLMVKLIEGVAIYSQLLFKIYCLIHYKYDFAHLIREMNYFWEVDEQNSSFKQLTFLYKILLYVFMTGVTAAVVIYISKPFLPGHTLPTEVWIPNVYFFDFKTIYFYELIIIIYIFVSIVAFDIFFAAISFAILLQFRLLNDRFSFLEFDKKSFDKEKFAKCIGHHVFLSKCISTLKRIYSNFFVFQVLSSVGLLTIELTTVIIDHSDISDMFKNIFISIAVTCQFCLYCLPAAEITKEAERISQSIFYNNWYDSEVNIKMYVQFVIMNTQRTIAFSAGGIADISRETITFIFKSTMSLIAMIRSIQK